MSGSLPASTRVRPVLADARFALVPDGRRWLRAHSDKRFDVILSSTAYRWRSGITLITSREFMRIVRSHVNPNGVFVFNTAYSEIVVATACEAFAHGVQIGDMILGSDTAFDLSAGAARRRLSGTARLLRCRVSMFNSWLLAWPGLVLR